MTGYTREQIDQILRTYNADHDLGPDCPVTWREERLAQAVVELQEQIEALEMKVSHLVDRISVSSGREY